MEKTYLIIPAYNEGDRLNQTLALTRKYQPNLPIVVIDDGSTKSILKDIKKGVTILHHKINLGKGAALKTGIEFAIKQGADNFILMDSDLQHDPKHLSEIIEKLSQGYDIVFTRRDFGLQTPLIRFLGNKFSSIYMRLFFGIYIADIPCGFRAFNKKAYELIKWNSSRYGVETEMVARLGKHQDKLKHTTVPIKAIYIDKYKGFTPIEAVKILLNSIWWKFN